MSKDKKDIDYWDKYYGSGKNKTRPYFHKKDDSESYKNKEYDLHGRLIGSEYKVRPPRKKRRRSPVLSFTILIVFVFLAGFFTFYALDNHLFNKNNTSSNLSSNTKNEVASSLTSNQTTTQQDEILLNAQASQASQSSQEISKDNNQETQNNNSSNLNSKNQTDSNNANSNSSNSLWQALLLFFKNFGKQQVEKSSYPRQLKLNFYFAVTGNEEKFGVEQRTIPAGNSKNAVINAVNELLKGPYENYNFAVIPPGTKLLGVEVENNIAKVNFSQEFLTESLDNRILDEYIIYTIVDTLTQIPQVDAVVFLIDGKVVTEYGNIDLRLPAIKEEKYIKQ